MLRTACSKTGSPSSLVLSKDFSARLLGRNPASQRYRNVATNRSEKVQRAVLFRGGRRSWFFNHSSASSHSEERPKGPGERAGNAGKSNVRSPMLQLRWETGRRRLGQIPLRIRRCTDDSIDNFVSGRQMLTACLSHSLRNGPSSLAETLSNSVSHPQGFFMLDRGNQ